MKKDVFKDKGLLKKLSADPFTDWVIILVSGLIVVLALVAVGVWVYLGTEAKLSSEPVVGPAVSEASFSPDKLGQVVSGFDDRATRTQAIVKGLYSATKDPSLP